MTEATPVVVVKAEPLDPLKMDMDDEAEITNFDSERVDKQVALATTGDAVAPAAPGEPEPEAILRLAEFVAPPPVKLTKAQREKALATIDSRAYEAAGEVDPLTGEADGPKVMTRGAELQAVLVPGDVEVLDRVFRVRATLDKTRVVFNYLNAYLPLTSRQVRIV